MTEKKVWIVTVDMGYGHQRATYPLSGIAYERVITANSDKIVVPKEKKQWKKLQIFYEGVSRLHSIPLIGKFLWHVYDSFQEISPLYPFRDLSAPNLGTIYLDKMIKKNFLKSVIHYISKKKIPLVTTFFAPAIAASYQGLKEVYCVVTDTDVNRVWVPKNSKRCKIFYFAPTERAQKRLIAYGVPKKNIYFTGFPLPEENTGENLEHLKKDLKERLHYLDPKRVFASRYGESVKKVLGDFTKVKSNRPLTITFVVGGAGAQKEIGLQIIKSFREEILKKRIRINISVGTRLELARYYNEFVHKIGLEKELGKYVGIFSNLDKRSYFKQFNQILKGTDILWTKPSELSFYVALGIPLIIAPPLGSHEEFNKKWIIQMSAGIEQEDPRYANEWFFDMLEKGTFADAAWQGFMEAPKHGTHNIKKLLFSRDKSNIKMKY